jgi:hypothetical protein
MMLRRLDFHLGVKRPREPRGVRGGESIANERHKCSSRGRRRHPDRLDGVVARRSLRPARRRGDLKTARNPTRTVPDRDRIAFLATFGANGETLGEIGPQVSREEGGRREKEKIRRKRRNRGSLPKPISVRVLPSRFLFVFAKVRPNLDTLSPRSLSIPPPHAPLCLPRVTPSARVSVRLVPPASPRRQSLHEPHRARRGLLVQAGRQCPFPSVNLFFLLWRHGNHVRGHVAVHVPGGDRNDPPGEGDVRRLREARRAAHSSRWSHRRTRAPGVNV